jgi:aspartyl aminopeptidase
VSSTGAESSLIPSLLHRLSPTASTVAQSIAKSFLISADMGHAVHPSYLQKHEENHRPVMNGGIVLKTNAKQRYTTDSISAFLIKMLVERKGGMVQEYEVRNDMYDTVYVPPICSPLTVILRKQGLRFDSWT